MEKSDSVLKILVPYPTAHDVKSGVSTILDNITKELAKKTNVKIVRLIFQSEKIIKLPEPDEFNQVLDMRNFDNAISALKTIQPDIIYTTPKSEFINISFISAATFLGIPTVGLVMIGFEKELELNSNLLLNSRKIFDRSVPTDIYVENSSFLRRIRFIFYKFNFMRKTFSAINNIQAFKKTLKTLKQIFSKNPFTVDLPLSKHFVVNSFQKNILLKYGFNEKNIIITGHPLFDDSFTDSNNNHNNKIKNNLNILFAPDTLAEAGIWPKEQQEKTISKILLQISSIQNSSIVIKIHPASAKIENYESIIKKINSSSSIFKKGSIVPLFKEADVLIAYSAYSTSLIHGLIYGLPIIICNFYDDIDDIFQLIKSNVAHECKEPESILKHIKNLHQEEKNFESFRHEYIKNFLYSDDGKSSERIALEILKITNKLKD